LVHDVLVDLPGRDRVRDFLAKDGDVLRVYESSGLDTDVTDQSPSSVLTATDADRYSLTAPVTDGFFYARMPDPYGGNRAIGAVYRSDGKRIQADNTWLSKTRRMDNGWDYFIHLFDV